MAEEVTQNFGKSTRTGGGEGGATTAHACTLRAGRAKIKTLAAEWTEVFITAGWIGALNVSNTFGIIATRKEMLDYFANAIKSKVESGHIFVSI